MATKAGKGTHPLLALVAVVVLTVAVCWYVGHKIDHPLTSSLPLTLLCVPLIVGLTVLVEGRGMPLVVGGIIVALGLGYIAVDAGRTAKVAHAMYQLGSQLPGEDAAKAPAKGSHGR